MIKMIIQDDDIKQQVYSDNRVYLNLEKIIKAEEDLNEHQKEVLRILSRVY